MYVINSLYKVANLSLYAVALIVFSVIDGKTPTDVQNQVCMIVIIWIHS